MSIKALRTTFLFFFFLSGACGLIYENLWFKILRLIFGNTTFALSTVLAAFMSGLALGSWLLGRYIDRKGNPLVVYGLLECVIGVWCFFTPFFKDLIQALYVNFYQAAHPSFYILSLFRFFLSFLVLLVPTICMGGTLPVLTKFWVRREPDLGKGVSILYAMNTFGAFAGVITSGFLLFPNMGIRAIFSLTALVNIGIGVLSVVFAFVFRRTVTVDIRDQDEETRQARGPVSAVPFQKWLIAGLFLSGIASMVYEVCWTRVLAMLIGSSVYAFTIILAAFLAGIFLGSFLFRFIPGRARGDVKTFVILEMLIGASVLVCLPLMHQIPALFLALQKVAIGNYYLLQLGTFFLSASLILLPAGLIGISFPLGLQLYTSGAQKGFSSSTGILYAANTLGCIIGAWITGFILVPIIGIHKSILAGVLVNVFAGLIGPYALKNTIQFTRASKIILFLCGLVFIGSFCFVWPENLFTLGIYRLRDLSESNPAAYVERLKKQENLIFYKEGIVSTIAVVQHGSKSRSLRVNGKTDASNSLRDMTTQVLLAYLPLLFVNAADNVLIVGLGTGVTAASAAHFPVKHIDVVEIEPAVVKASDFFTKENERVRFLDQRLNISIEDGRNYLLQTGKKYDVIILEPSNPWMEGVASLFTLEYYQLLQKQVAENGIVCQWVQSYLLRPEDLRMIFNTFSRAFPYVSVWKLDGDLLLLGSNHTVLFDSRKISEIIRDPKIRRQLRAIGFESAFSLLTCFTMDNNAVRACGRGADINTDDLNVLEYAAPKYLYDSELALINANMLESSKSSLESIVTEEDKKQVKDLSLHLNFAYTFLKRDFVDKAIKEFNGVARFFPDNALSYYIQGRFAEYGLQRRKAIDLFKKAIALDSEVAEYRYALAQVYESFNEYGAAEQELRKAIQIDPQRSEYLFLLGRILLQQNRIEEAFKNFQQALQLKRDERTPVDSSFEQRSGKLAKAVTGEEPRDGGLNVDDEEILGYLLKCQRLISGNMRLKAAEEELHKRFP